MPAITSSADTQAPWVLCWGGCNSSSSNSAIASLISCVPLLCAHKLQSGTADTSKNSYKHSRASQADNLQVN
jgi:hypothetical protein